MIVVTGGSGFVGRHLIEKLLDYRPDGSIRVLDVEPPPSSIVEKVDYVPGSVLDRSAIRTAVADTDTVVHLAAKVDPSAEDDQALKKINAQGSRNVYLEAAAAGCRMFVHLSSSGVYGRPTRDRPFRTTDPPNPQTPYQRSKWEAEQQLLQGVPRGTVVNILRPAGIYGPGSYLEIPRYQKVRRQKRVFELPGGVVVHPTYVSDVVSAVEALLEGPAPHGSVFNVGGERAILVQDLEALIAEELGTHRRRHVLSPWIAYPLALVVSHVSRLAGRPKPDLRRMSRGDTLSAAVDDRQFRERYPTATRVPLRLGIHRHISWARAEGLLGRSARRGGR